MKNNFKKGFVVPLVIAIVVILIAGGVYWGVKSKEAPANNNNVVACTQEAKLCPDGSSVGRTGPTCEFTACPSGNQSNLIKSCANGATNPPHCNADQPMPLPIISSISPSSGAIGTVVELKGTNLAGFEGDLDAIIENSKGETAFLPGIGSVPRTDQTIRVKIDSKLCKSNNGYSGLPCTSFLAITPGTYKIYTAPWGKVSNKVMFTVTTSNSQPSITVLSPNGGETWQKGTNQKVVVKVAGNTSELGSFIEVYLGDNDSVNSVGTFMACYLNGTYTIPVIIPATIKVGKSKVYVSSKNNKLLTSPTCTRGKDSWQPPMIEINDSSDDFIDITN